MSVDMKKGAEDCIFIGIDDKIDDFFEALNSNPTIDLQFNGEAKVLYGHFQA